MRLRYFLGIHKNTVIMLTIKIYYQECNNGTWQKPVQLITNETINNYQNGIGIGQTLVKC